MDPPPACFKKLVGCNTAYLSQIPQNIIYITFRKVYASLNGLSQFHTIIELSNLSSQVKRLIISRLPFIQKVMTALSILNITRSASYSFICKTQSFTSIYYFQKMFLMKLVLMRMKGPIELFHSSALKIEASGKNNPIKMTHL